MIHTGGGFSFIRTCPKFDQFVKDGYKIPSKTPDIKDSFDSISKLEKLAQLKENGYLSDEEFENEKNKIIYE
ncbi:MAG: SHOCT domain-containing protein [Prolixibacteraceae bacterium]|nr:SHOCT domain-containing protein [Prolixibacteraceae bacterium]